MNMNDFRAARQALRLGTSSVSFSFIFSLFWLSSRVSGVIILLVLGSRARTSNKKQEVGCSRGRPAVAVAFRCR